MIEYKIVQRANPRDLEKPKKYFATAQNTGDANFRDFINDIANLSTVNTPDIVAVLESLFQLIPKYLKDGRIIKLGDLGSFTVLLDSIGQDKEKDVSIRDIKKAKIRFIPSKLLKEEVNQARYRKVKLTRS